MKTKTTEKLVDLLENGIDVHRCAAARALGDMGMPQATNALGKALLDEDPDVRTDAAIALGKVNDPKTAQLLMDNLIGDPESDVKKAAIEALIAMRHEPVIPLLRKLAISRSEDEIAWDEEAFYTDGWDGWIDIQLAAVKGLSAFEHEPAVPDILTVLDDEEGQDITETCFEALARMGQSGAEALVMRFETGSERIRRRIASAVLKSDNPHLGEIRDGMLTDPAPVIRKIALNACDPSDEGLQPLFSDPDNGVRGAVVARAGAQNQPLLWDMIKDPSDEVRAEVFKVIAADPAQFRDEELIKAVQAQIKGEPEAAKQAALALIALKGPKVAKGLTHVLQNENIPEAFRIGVIEALQKAGNIAVPALLGVAGDPNRQLRLTALTALAGLAADDPVWPNDAGNGLLSALKGELVLPPEQPEIEEAPEAEPQEKPDLPEITPEIAQEIDEALPLVVEEKQPMSTLDRIKANAPDLPKEEPEPITLSEDEARLLETTKTRKLAKRKVSLDTIVAPHLDVKRFAARLLGGVVNKDVTSALITALAECDDDEMRDALLFSLAAHGAQTGVLPQAAQETLQALLGSADSSARVQAARAYGWLDDESIESMLHKLLENPDELVRVEAVKALERRGIADEAILAALNDPYLGVSVAAAHAVASIQRENCAGALLEFAVANDGTFRRDVGRLFGQYAPKAGALALLDLLSDETRKPLWLVAIDALAELFQQPHPSAPQKVA